jgi:hypothetical protein
MNPSEEHKLIDINDFTIHDQKFKLYDELYESHKHQTHFDQITQLIQLLRRLDHRGLQIVGLLIKKHVNNNDIPYQGQSITAQEVKFDVRNFDPILQYILLDFAVRYVSNIS